MGPVATSFAIACGVTLGVTWLAADLRTRAVPIFGTASFVFVMFFVSQSIGGLMTLPWSMAHYAVQDLVLIALLLWTRNGSNDLWRVAVGLLLLVQSALAVFYWGGYVAGATDNHTLREYILRNNIALAGILICLTVAGGVHVWAGRGDLLALLRVFRRWALAKPARPLS